MLKFFEDEDLKTIDSLKKKYRKLAFQYHPDIEGGNTETMKKINNEYEEAIKIVGINNDKKYTFDKEYITIIDTLIKMHMKNVTIEVCGWFVYVSGDTKPYKKELKEAGLFWNTTKLVWYYKPNWYIKRDNKIWSMEKIRGNFGSEIVENKENKKEERELITATA